MKPTFKDLLKSHYSSNDQKENFVDAEKLYTEIGYDYSSMVKQNLGYRNTCVAKFKPCGITPSPEQMLALESSRLWERLAR